MRRFEDNTKIQITGIEQDSDEWLDWRNQGIGSSDVALLMHPEPLFDRTVGSLWNQRVGYERTVQLNNEHIKRGKELEPFIRDKVNSMLGSNFQPECLIRTDASYLRASLDGLDEDLNAILEIKSPSEPVFKKYLSTWEIPRNYYYQMQYQMLVSNVDYGLFAFYNSMQDEEGNLIHPLPYIIPVKNNHELQLDIERRCALFWGAVQNKIPIGWEDGNLQYYHIRPLLVVFMTTLEHEKQMSKWDADDCILPRIKANAGVVKYSCWTTITTSSLSDVITLRDKYPNHRIEIVNLAPSPYSATVDEMEITTRNISEKIMSLI